MVLSELKDIKDMLRQLYDVAIANALETRMVSANQDQNLQGNNFTTSPICVLAELEEREAKLKQYMLNPNFDESFSTYRRNLVLYYSTKIKIAPRHDKHTGLMKSLFDIYFERCLLQKIGWTAVAGKFFVHISNIISF